MIQDILELAANYYCHFTKNSNGFEKKGKLILLASHNPLDIDILCDCVYELDAGTIVNQRSILPR